MGHSAKAIANEYLDLAKVENRFLTTMEVIKLVYIDHGWNLAFTGNSMIRENVEAWRHGPVIRDLWDEFKVFGSGPILQYADGRPAYAKLLLTKPWENASYAIREDIVGTEKVILESVWNAYKEYSAFQLSALTHQPRTPWSISYVDGQNVVIDNDLIKDHYNLLKAERTTQQAVQ